MRFYFIRISAKGRYALAATVSISESYAGEEYITIINTSEELGISKIYLEQIFSLLKRDGLVNSIKRAQGGYRLPRIPRRITVYQVLSAVEFSLFEPVEDTVVEKAPDIEKAMYLSTFEELDKAVADAFSAVTLTDLATETKRHREEDTFVFYI